MMIATRRNGRFSPVIRLFSFAFKLCNSAGVLPKLDVVTVDHSLGAFLRSVVIIADEIDGLNKIAVAANQVCSIVRHWVLTSADEGRCRANRACCIPSGRSK
jgi:hypothetical protein